MAIKTQFSSDRPIRNKDEDRYNRWPFALRIAETLARRVDTSSIVIGLYGAWGDGKTSTLAMMEQALDQEAQVTTVRFNPWLFKSQEQLLCGFFATLAEALGRSLPTRSEEIGRLVSRYGGLLSLATVGVAGGLVQISPGEAVKNLGKAMSNVELDTLRFRIEKILNEAGTRVVVFIDDIDRLDHQEIYAIFKLVKLSAGFDYTSYVLAFDDKVVAASLGERYGEGGSNAGRSFLEKIIQVPLHLPPAEPISLRKATFEGIDEAIQVSGVDLTKEQAEAFVRYFVDGIEPRVRTPRHGKLYANALMFSLPILRGEVNPVDQMLVEGIRIFYPKLYTEIRDHREYFVISSEIYHRDRDFQDLVQSTINESLNDLSERDRQTICSQFLANLFPRLKGIFGNTHYGPEWDKTWEEEKRVCSEAYFPRYFGYGVPFGDIPDAAISGFLQLLETENHEEIDGVLNEFKANDAVAKVIRKLRQREDEISPMVGRQLALAFARNCDVIPREQAMFSADRSLMQSAILVSKMVKNLATETARAELAFKIIEISKTLWFAFEFFRWIRKSDDQAEEERIISAKNETRLAKILVARIRDVGREKAIYKKFGQDTPKLLWIWNRFGPQGELSSYLRERFDLDSSEVGEFIGTFLGVSWGLESGISRRSDFDRDNYDAVKEYIDPDYIMEKLRDTYGAELDNPQYHNDDETPLDRRLAHQFAYVHSAACAEESVDSTKEEDDH